MRLSGTIAPIFKTREEAREILTAKIASCRRQMDDPRAFSTTPPQYLIRDAEWRLRWIDCAPEGANHQCAPLQDKNGVPCGGTYNECPPGAVASPTSWIGTCVNPDDNQAYLIAYQDCCGKDSCGQCLCLGTEGEMPSYRPELNNDIIWCFGAPTMVYHCSSQVVIGKA